MSVGSILAFLFLVMTDGVTWLALAPVVTEVIFSYEQGRLVNEKPTNEAIIIRPIEKQKLINREWSISSSVFLGSSPQQPTCDS